MSKIITKKQLNLVIESTLKTIKEGDYMMEDNVCECGGPIVEGLCEGCGASYMGEGDYMDEEKGKYDDGDGKDEKCDYVPCNEEYEDDMLEYSVNDLAESVIKTTNNEILKEGMDFFNKMINYRK
jgi:hypothetical protein